MDLRRIFARALVVAGLLAATAPAAADQYDDRLGGLFDQLGDAAGPDEGAVLTREIWRVWLENGDPGIGTLLARGMIEMSHRRLERARAIFTLVTQRDPDFAEGWNKRATANYLLGNYDESIGDIGRTLALEPRHFGAISGLGLVWLRLGDATAAREAFSRALAINPWLSDTRQRIEQLDDQPDGEPI